MAYELPHWSIGTMSAAANLSSATHQYRCVAPTSEAIFNLRTSSTTYCLGVLQDRPSSGEAGNICYYGVTKARVLSTSHTGIAINERLAAGSSGGVVPSTAATHYVLGRSLSVLSSASTGVITMLITHQGYNTTGQLL